MMEIGVRTESVASVLSQLRSVPERMVPYATSTALTRSAQRARDDIVAAMLSSFDRPTQYTLNSLFVVPSTVQTLRARVHVKDKTSRGGTLPQDYLLPEVEGGQRKNKRLENALRYAGWLPSGWFAIVTRAAAPLLDENGNIPRAIAQRILVACGARTAKTKQAQRAAADYFAIAPNDAYGRLRAGVYKREASHVYPVLIFTSVQPKYAVKLDFTAIAQRSAEAAFPGEFARALSDQLAKRGAA